METTPGLTAVGQASRILRNESGRLFIETNDELNKAAQYILKAACSLMHAEGCFLALKTQSGVRTYRISSRGLTALEKNIMQKSLAESETLLVVNKQQLYNRAQESMGEAATSYIAAPLLTDGKQVLGALLWVTKLGEENFSEEDLSLASTFSRTFARMLANCIAAPDKTTLLVKFSSNLVTVFENLYLYRKNLENNFLLSEMIKVSKMINSTLDLNSLLESIMDSAKIVLKAEASSLMLIDRKTNELFFNIISGEKERDLKEIRIPIGVGIAGIVADTCKPLVVNDAQNDERVYKQADEKINFVTRNLIATPLMVRNRIIGVIEVINSVGRTEFSEKDLELFNTFSEQAALAIHNRELIDSLKDINRELKKKVHELSSLHEIGKVLMSTLNEKDLFDSIVRIIADEMQADRVSIMIYAPDHDALEIISHYGLDLSPFERTFVPLDRSLAGKSYRDLKLIYTNALEKSPYAAFRDIERYHTGGCIIQPLMHGQEIYGVLNISDRHAPTGHEFTDDDLRLVSTIASQITRSIQNFRLLNEMLQKRSYEKELEITSSIQKSILPTHFQKSAWFDMGVISEPAKLMGGDFYDFLAFDGDQFVFSVADVSGKSLPAALFMAVTSSIIRTYGREVRKPAEVLHKANELIYQDSQSGMFVTLFYAYYDAPEHQLFYSSAGHNEQLVFRHDTRTFEKLGTRGRPLGVVDSQLHGPFGEGKVFLSEGDLLILYTDGVVEAINERKEEFGLDRFCRIISDNMLLSSDQLVKKIFREVKTFAGTEAQYDDFTLMIIKILK
ncbi:MAG TPA: SpoIIE family protein phosphatase [Turneriella sp.]|nr:SpoIIE family protein phosphatase [Turneriella sp.]HNA77954.1 SpoIIE family protein phosphatase [Turneriella sp.]HNE18577.1 SpoIIE family protein phosphatase [Turneriella sp.]HNM99694.1 SpoIIE family protein phosphatase [Turneriella sp.]